MAQLERLKTDLDLAGRHVFGPAAPSAATDLVRWQDIGSQAINLPPGAVAFGAASGGGITSDPDLTYDATNHVLKLRVADPHSAASIYALTITSPNVIFPGNTYPTAFTGLKLMDDAAGTMLSITANKQGNTQQVFSQIFVEGTLAASEAGPVFAIRGRSVDRNPAVIVFTYDQDVFVGPYVGIASTSSTVGFFHFPGIHGAPLNPPAHQHAQTAAMAYDYLFQRLYIYDGDQGPWRYITMDNGLVGSMAASNVVVTQSSSAFSGATNLGALASGVLQQTVSGSVSTPAVVSVAAGVIPFGAATGGGLAQDANLFYDPVNHKITIHTNDPTNASQKYPLVMSSPSSGGISSATSGIDFQSASGQMALLHVNQSTPSGTQKTAVMLKFPGTGTGTNASEFWVQGDSVDGQPGFAVWPYDQDVGAGSFAGIASTSSTVGFFHFGAMSGAPTGVPVHKSANTVTLTYDLSDHRLYIYESDTGPWRYVILDNGAAANAYSTIQSPPGTSLTQRTVLAFASALTASDDAGNTRTLVDLAAVGPGAGTIGSSGQMIESITLDAKGRVTAASAVTASSGGADALGRYLVSRSTNAPANAVNLGALTSGFLTQTVSGGVATLSIDASTYLTTSSAASTYETQSHASSTYLTITGAAATYETQSHASSTYQPILTSGTGIAIASNTVSAKLSTGVSGGQSVVGGTAASESLTLSSTTNGTKGRILCGSFFALDETNARVLVGTQTAGTGVPLTVASTFSGTTGSESISSAGNIVITGTSSGIYYTAGSGTLELYNTNSGGGVSLRTNSTRRLIVNGSGSIQAMNSPWVSFASGSGTVPSGATVAEWALTPPSIASASGAVLDGHKWDATTVTITGSTNITTATGFNWVTFEQPTFSAANALTITHAATVCIKGGPLNGGAGPAIFTNDYALWVQNDPARFDGFILAQGGISTNFGAHLNLSTPTTAQHINLTAGAVTYLTADGSADMLALAQGTHSVLSIFSAGPDFHGGKRIVFLADRDALPTGDPSGGGYLYSDSGALKWRGSSGTITTIAPA